DIFYFFNIIQHVDFPTQKKGHTLDLVRTTGITISNLTSIDLTISDHLAITLDINTSTTHVKQKRTTTFQTTKSINLPSLSSVLAATVSASVSIPTPSPAPPPGTPTNFATSNGMAVNLNVWPKKLGSLFTWMPLNSFSLLLSPSLS